MSDVEWREWVTYHATLFRMSAEEDLRMIGLWRVAFEGRGYSASELKEASLHLAQTDSHRWRSEHLEAILLRISGRRLQQAMMHRAEQAVAAPACGLCSGTGLVPVPHPDCVINNEWVHPFYTCAVACSCPKGFHAIQKNSESINAAKEALEKGGRNKMKPPPRLWPLDEYEQKNPGWKIQVEDADERRKSERQVRLKTQLADKDRGPLLGALDRVMRQARRG